MERCLELKDDDLGHIFIDDGAEYGNSIFMEVLEEPSRSELRR